MMEEQVVEATARGAIEGGLRYGMLYAPDTPSTLAMVAMVRRPWLPVVRGDAGRLPLIHVDDAVSATLSALEVAPYMARMSSIRLSLSNARAKADLGWRPVYPTMRDGVSRMFRPVA